MVLGCTGSEQGGTGCQCNMLSENLWFPRSNPPNYSIFGEGRSVEVQTDITSYLKKLLQHFRITCRIYQDSSFIAATFDKILRFVLQLFPWVVLYVSKQISESSLLDRSGVSLESKPFIRVALFKCPSDGTLEGWPASISTRSVYNAMHNDVYKVYHDAPQA